MKLLGSYKNGNYYVKIYDDGTKERIAPKDSFHPAFAENCDICITKKCDGGCPWCYEGCTPDGKHADIMNQKWGDSLHPYTELAINGNDLSHPDLIDFLHKLHQKKIIANLTVNQKHFIRHTDFLKVLCDAKYVYGLGVSLVEASDEFINEIKRFPNAVIHTINGILSKKDLDKLADNGLKILVLGYKDMRRGTQFLLNNIEEVASKQQWLYDHISEYFDKFDCISFDNLALDQLQIKRFLSEEEWEEFYMGDDGGYTFYIDAVDGKYSKNSVAPMDERYDLLETVDEMFVNILKSSE